MEEETVVVNGCTIKIKYSDKQNPAAVATMRDILEKSKREPLHQQKLTGKDKNEKI